MANSGPGGTAPRPAASRSTVSLNPFQVLALLLGFVLLATVGGVLAAGLVVPIAAGANAVARGTTQAFYDLPTELEPGALAEASYVYASDGTTLLATYYYQNRVVVPAEQMSQHLRDAVVAIEDKRFYQHSGVDAEGLSRALVTNVASGSAEQGGSTLTQQYVKNVLIQKAAAVGDTAGVNAAKASTLSRKLREAKLAIAIEDRMTKDEILTNYLNIAQFGASVSGVEAAAQHYFGKSAADVTIAEAATIAGTTQRPTAFDAIANTEASQARRNVVLSEMYKQGKITKEEHDAARATPLAENLNPQPITQGCAGAGGAAYFCDYVTQVIKQDPVFGETAEDRENLLLRGGLNIVTTIDLGAQAIADEEVRNAVSADDPQGFAAALVTVEPGTGKILTMAQNRTYSAEANPPPGSTLVNYSTDRNHGGSGGFQPGSTFKTFVLAQWLKEGHTLNESVSANSREWKGSDFTATTCANFAGSTWNPKNWDGQGSGNRTVLQATADSINTAYATMSSKVDLCGVADLAYAVGFRPATVDPETGDAVVPRMGMTLGTQETSPLAMANAYATFASGGVHCNPVAIVSVTNRVGEELPIPQAACAAVPGLDPAVVNGVNHALQAVIGPNGGASRARLNGHTAAGKTGTTNNNADNWFVGYTPARSTAFWMGHPDNKTITLQRVTINGQYYSNVYGSTIAAPTWKRYMDRILAGSPDIPFAAVGQAQLGNTTPAPRQRRSTPTPAPSRPAPAPTPAAPAAPETGNVAIVPGSVG